MRQDIERIFAEADGQRARSCDELTRPALENTIRAHWGVESKLHWVLHIAFREDDARHRARNMAQNLATLRHFALNIVAQDREASSGLLIYASARVGTAATSSGC